MPGHVYHFWTTLRYPRVFVFILVGVGVIFLTFLTTNNALEIAISGIASVFIGIGVNNFTSQETHQRDLVLLKQQQKQAVQLLSLLETRLKSIREQALKDQVPANTELDEINQLLSLLQQVLGKPL